MMLRPLCAATVVVCLSFLPGCFLLPDDGSGTVNLGECIGGPVALSVPVKVYCEVTRITATISGPDMTTINVTIDRTHPALTLTIPSGPDRQLVVKVFTSESQITPFFTSARYVFCVPDGEPVSVKVDVAQQNRTPEVGAISPAGGDVSSGQPVALSVSASDPDECDSVESYEWSTAFGSISGSGSTVIWTPQCPDDDSLSCDATVSVTVRDGRGGAATTQATFRSTAYYTFNTANRRRL